jgi:alkylation response protein AidB-like acyl-CoA dehydrogenase
MTFAPLFPVSERARDLHARVSAFIDQHVRSGQTVYAEQMAASTDRSEDTVLPLIFAGARAIRFADGPDEVHARVIARHEFEEKLGLRI